MFFSVVLLIFSLLAFVCAAGLPVVCKKESRLSAVEKIPRAKKTGIIWMAAVIFWCIPNIRPILEPGSSLQSWLIPLAILCIILCWFFLDYLFARAFAAFLILTAHYFLKESFAAHMFPFSVPLAISLFLLGIAGILIGAKPYWLRDWLRLVFKDKRVCIGSSIYLLILSVSGLVVSILMFTGKYQNI